MRGLYACFFFLHYFNSGLFFGSFPNLFAHRSSYIIIWDRKQVARVKNRNNFGGSRQQDVEFALASYMPVFVLKMKVKYDHFDILSVWFLDLCQIVLKVDITILPHIWWKQKSTHWFGDFTTTECIEIIIIINLVLEFLSGPSLVRFHHQSSKDNPSTSLKYLRQFWPDCLCAVCGSVISN